MTFHELPALSWCQYHGKIVQKLPNLNGSNAYALFKGYDYIRPSEQIIPIEEPRIGKIEPSTPRPVCTLWSNGHWSFQTN